MRFFQLDPGGGYEADGSSPVNEALESISAQLVALGARKAVLIVEDDHGGATIAVGRRDGCDDTPKATTDLLLRVALDAKSVVVG